MNRTERNAMVVENLPLVGYLVSDLCAKATHLSRDDMASAGAVALITAADAYKPELGIPFGAYARKRVLGAFADEMRAGDWATRGARRRIKETLAVQETLTSALGRTPNVEEIANALGVERSVASEALTDASRTLSSLDDTTAEFLASTTPLPEETLLEGEQLRYLRTAVQALPEKMRFVIEQIYFEDRSVKEVAEELGTTHSAVSQQRAEAIRLLRDGLGAHYSDAPEVAHVPESRISASSRDAYLSRLGAQANVGVRFLGANAAPHVAATRMSRAV